MLPIQVGTILHLCTNLKRIAQIVQVIKGGPEIKKVGHVTPATLTLGSFYGPYAGRLRPLWKSERDYIVRVLYKYSY